MKKTEFTAETGSAERIYCIDDNEDALLWRLRMIGSAKESEVLCSWGILIEHDGKDYPFNAFAILTTPLKCRIVAVKRRIKQKQCQIL